MTRKKNCENTVKTEMGDKGKNGTMKIKEKNRKKTRTKVWTTQRQMIRKRKKKSNRFRVEDSTSSTFLGPNDYCLTARCHSHGLKKY
jgi:hypothetical protein